MSFHRPRRIARSNRMHGMHGGHLPALRGAVLCSAILLGTTGCGPDLPVSTGPNIVLISVDTLRADRMSAYGYERSTTPEIDAFFVSGTRFRNALSASPCTRPAVVQMLTGRIAPESANDRIAERLEASGYQTAAIVSQHFFRDEEGPLPEFARGFESFDVQEPHVRNHYGMTGRLAEDVTDRALAWLDGRQPGRPFFLWLHLYDPHDPYTAPARHRIFAPTASETVTGDRRKWLLRAGHKPWEKAGHVFSDEQVRFIGAQYDAEIRYVDAELGRLFAGLGARDLLEYSMVVLTADHGERLGEGNWWDHCQSLHQREMRVPLLIRMPGGAIAAQSEIRHAATTLDLFPTFLEVAGIEDDDHRDGDSLLRPLPDRIVRTVWQGNRVAFLPPWKYVARADGNAALYDVAEDPEQRRDRLAEEPELAALLAGSLDASRDELDRAARRSEQIVEELRSLGYID